MQRYGMARAVPGEMADSIKERELILAISLLKFLSSRVTRSYVHLQKSSLA